MYKHILIATDGSELAGKAVAAGLALAKRLGAQVTAVTAIEPWLSIASSDTAGAFMEYQKAESRTPRVSSASSVRRPRHRTSTARQSQLPMAPQKRSSRRQTTSIVI